MIYLIVIGTLIKVVDLCYLFQIKEYRFDRFRSTLFEEGPLNILYLRRPRLPAKSVRNFLIFAVAILIVWIVLTLHRELWYSVGIVAITLLISPVLALLSVTLGVLLTKPLAYAMRRRTIVQAVKKLQSHTPMVTIGISGSYGKTSTKEFLYQMLSTKYHVAKTDANKNTDVGVAQSIIRNVTPDTEFFVAEVGAYKKGEVRTASQVFRPQNAIITAFGNQHLSLYGSRENLIEAEGEILELLPENGTAYINKDIYSFIHTSKRTKAAVTSFSTTTTDADISASDIRLDPNDRLTAQIRYQGHSFRITAPLVGSHNIENLLPCIAFCLDHGMTRAEVAAALKKLQPIVGKLSTHQGPGESFILNDTGNSSLHGFLAAISAISDMTYRKNVIISKGIIELGKEKESSYKQIVSTIANRPIQLFTTDRLFKKYDTTNQVVVCRSEAEILAKIQPYHTRSSLILLEGKFSPVVAKSLILL